MYRIIYSEKSLTIQKNASISGWHPLWNTIVEAFKFEDIDEELFSELSEDDQEMIHYFFEDLETSLKLSKEERDSLEYHNINDICKCSHKKSSHSKFFDGLFIGCQLCSCKKFERKNEN